MLKKLHKIIGLSVCIIVIHLSITGIILMYPSTFKLLDTYYTNSYLYNLYGMFKTSDVKVLESNDKDIGVIKSKLILSDMVLDTGNKDIIGILKINNLIYALKNNFLFLIEEGDFQLEVLKKEELPFSAKSIGISNNEVILKDVKNKYYIINKDLNFFLAPKNKDLNTQYSKSNLISTDKETADYFLFQVQGPGIQALRLLTDLHNGRFFGPLVMIIFSITSLAVIFLAISGTWISLNITLKRSAYKKRKHRRHN